MRCRRQYLIRPCDGFNSSLAFSSCSVRVTGCPVSGLHADFTTIKMKPLELETTHDDELSCAAIYLVGSGVAVAAAFGARDSIGITTSFRVEADAAAGRPGGVGAPAGLPGLKPSSSAPPPRHGNDRRHPRSGFHLEGLHFVVLARLVIGVGLVSWDACRNSRVGLWSGVCERRRGTPRISLKKQNDCKLQ